MQIYSKLNAAATNKMPNFIVTGLVHFLGVALLSLLISLLLGIGVAKAQGSEDSIIQASLRSEQHRIGSANGFSSTRYHLQYFLNSNGEQELEVYLAEAHWLAADTHLLVLRGRDINGDGLLDTWFYNEGAIIKTFQRPTDSKDAWPVVRKILQEQSLDESRWIATLVARELLSELFVTIEGEIQETKELERIQIDLYDLDYRIRDMQATEEDEVLVEQLRQVSSLGWQRLLERWTNSRIEDRHKRIMGDLALFLGGAAAFKGIRFLVAKALSTETIASIKKSLRSTIEVQKRWSARLGARMPKWIPVQGATRVSLVPSSLWRFTTESEAIAWLTRDRFFTRSLKNLGGFMRSSLESSWERRGYIATAQTIQLAVESYSRGYWKFSDAPLVLDHPVNSTKEFINEVAHDKGLLQNFSYMTLQTTLLSGVSEALQKRGAGLGLKYAVCSIVTIVDSTAVNVFVQGKTDTPRIAFDTAWELLVGGSQIHLDLHMLRWADSLSKSLKKPKLKLVGYLLGSLDQMAGYTLYNKATSTIFETPKDDSSGGAVNPAARAPELPPVVIVPVLAPQG